MLSIKIDDLRVEEGVRRMLKVNRHSRDTPGTTKGRRHKAAIKIKLLFTLSFTLCVEVHFLLDIISTK
jgi:hypothetical protein